MAEAETDDQAPDPGPAPAPAGAAGEPEAPPAFPPPIKRAAPAPAPVPAAPVVAPMEPRAPAESTSEEPAPPVEEPKPPAEEKKAAASTATAPEPFVDAKFPSVRGKDGAADVKAALLPKEEAAVAEKPKDEPALVEPKTEEANPPEPERAPEPDPVPAAAPPIAAAGASAAGDRPFFKGPVAYALAALSGLLYFVAFAGVDIWPLTFVCLVPLILALHGQAPKRATWLGLLTGLAMNATGFYWLINMLKTFSGFPLPLCLLFTLIISAYQGGRLGLLGWLYGRATMRGWPRPIVFAAAFAASELVYPLLFPWYYAATIHQVPVLMQLSDLGGPILVGLVLVAINLAIAEPIRARLASKQGSAKTESGPANEERSLLASIDKRVIGAGVLSLLVALLYGAVRISITNGRVEKAESARVGYVQGNMSLMGKRENPSEGLRRHKEMTGKLREQGVDMVVWSETSATFPTREDLATKGNFFKDRFAASLAVPTIFGAVLYRVDPDRERWFNTAIGVDARGDIRGRYDKQFLLAFGEYLPFGETFPILYKWSPHSGRFSPGTSLEPIPMLVKNTEHKISVLICYEDILPGFTNRAVNHAKPELLVNMTNDAWFGDTTEPWQHLALAKFRAVEHHRFLIRSTNSGVSAVIDPNGRVVDNTVSKPFQPEYHHAVIRWLSDGTLYELIGDVPWYLVTLGIVIASFRRRDRKIRPPS